MSQSFAISSSFVLFVAFVVSNPFQLYWQREGKGGTLPDFALHPNLSPVQLDELLCQS